jgi:hypothetical protein
LCGAVAIEGRDLVNAIASTIPKRGDAVPAPFVLLSGYLIKWYKVKVKQSRYTPWRRLGGEEV